MFVWSERKIDRKIRAAVGWGCTLVLTSQLFIAIKVGIWWEGQLKTILEWTLPSTYGAVCAIQDGVGLRLRVDLSAPYLEMLAFEPGAICISPLSTQRLREDSC